MGYDYPIVHPVVMNYDLWRPLAAIARVVAGDNPGREEQAVERYLIGDAGEKCRDFLLEEGLDFGRDVLAFNKTPIHTHYTHELSRVHLPNGVAVAMQRELGRVAAAVAQTLGCPLWICGLTYLTGRFRPFVGAVRSQLGADGERLRVYQHFSRNKFHAELTREREKHPQAPLSVLLETIGRRQRRRKLGY